jgi:hypothetical protein
MRRQILNHILRLGLARAIIRRRPLRPLATLARAGLKISPRHKVLRPARLGQVPHINISTLRVIRIERHAIRRHRLAHAHIHVLPIPPLDPPQHRALVRQQLTRNPRRHHHLNLRHARRVKDRRQVAQRIGRHALGLLQHPSSAAHRAIREVHALMRRTHALTCHLKNAKLRDRPDRRLRTVTLQPVTDAVLDVLAMTALSHINEVIDNDAAHVAQAQLAADLIHRLEVRLVRVGLAVARVAALAAVDVDRNQRLGLIDHQPSTAG